MQFLWEGDVLEWLIGWRCNSNVGAIIANFFKCKSELLSSVLCPNTLVDSSITLCWSTGQCRVTSSLISLLHSYYLDGRHHELQSQINPLVRICNGIRASWDGLDVSARTVQHGDSYGQVVF